jgi:hypothetical protein
MDDLRPLRSGAGDGRDEDQNRRDHRDTS